MLEKDEDFYRKFIGVLNRVRTKNVKFSIEGNNIIAIRGDTVVRKIPITLFTKMNVDEILANIGGE